MYLAYTWAPQDSWGVPHGQVFSGGSSLESPLDSLVHLVPPVAPPPPPSLTGPQWGRALPRPEKEFISSKMFHPSLQRGNFLHIHSPEKKTGDCICFFSRIPAFTIMLISILLHNSPLCRVPMRLSLCWQRSHKTSGNMWNFAIPLHNDDAYGKIITVIQGLWKVHSVYHLITLSEKYLQH